MNAYHTSEIEDTDVEPRTERALTECMTVLPEGGDIFTIVGENENGEYRVDSRAGRCTCPDHKHREATCKYIRRATFATGEQPVPGDVDDVDEGEVLDEPVDGRPEDCDCGDWNAGEGLPCWPCYRDGFDTTASADE